MKQLIIVLLILLVVPLVRANEFKIKGYIKSDPIRGANHYLILRDDGKTKTRLKPDPIRSYDPGHYLIIDKDGNVSGRIKPDYLNEDSYIIETDKKD
jgi:hypothetical protein